MEQHNSEQNTNPNLNFPKRTCLDCGKTDDAIASCETCKPKGMLGWICPVCGRGNSPLSSTCPCKSTTGQIRYDNAPDFPLPTNEFYFPKPETPQQ